MRYNNFYVSTTVFPALTALHAVDSSRNTLYLVGVSDDLQMSLTITGARKHGTLLE